MNAGAAKDEPPPTAAGPYRTAFGGFWTDRTDAADLLQQKLDRGVLDAAAAELLQFWMERGYAVLPGAVPPELADRLLEEVEAAWRGDPGLLRLEYFDLERDEIRVVPPSPELRDGEYKLLNLHAASAVARDVIFAPAIRRFHELVFERPSLAFSTLYFERGTRQPLHQDTAYVGVGSPMELCASWIALEDIDGPCGQLEYFEGSHRLEPLVFDNGKRLMPQELVGNEEYYYHLGAKCTAAGLERVQFAPRKGDALIWHADLVHGGSQEVAPGTTRKSLVTHYCPADVDPDYFGYWEHSAKLEHRPRCMYCYYER